MGNVDYTLKTKANLKRAIYDVIVEQPGIKAVELVCKVMENFGHNFTYQDYDAAIDRLIEMEDIREEIYVNPEMPYRNKSKYFPMVYQGDM